MRPFSWEDPRPEDRASGLPPVALDALEFVKVSLRAAPKGTASPPGPPRPAGAYPGGAAPAPGGAPPARRRASRVAVRRRTLALAAVVALVISLIWVLGS